MPAWVAAVAAFSCALTIDRVASACESDAQCKGNRICEAGKCVTPAGASAGATETPKANPDEGKEDAPADEANADGAPQKTKKNRHKKKPRVEGGADASARDDEDEQNGKQSTSGLAIGGGFGFQTAGLGMMAAFYISVVDGFFVTPYVGFGALPIEGDWVGGPALGSMLILGNRHRLVMDVSWGVAGGVQLAPTAPGGTPRAEASYGASFALGYEYMSRGGFFVRLEAGATDMMSENWSKSGGASIQPTVQLALGGKWM